MRSLDLVVIGLYLVAMPALGMLLSGRQRTSKDYFVGSRQLPWWAVCFSVVATETSTLTVISVPTVAYLGTFTYLQLAIGYLIGRLVVAFVLLPKYYAGNLVSAYEFLGQRFGSGLQGTASVTFLLTRLLADGLRLFATAIPVKVILDSFNIHLAYWQIIAILAAFTVVYTYFGGIRAVVWVDAIQMVVYVGGAIAAGAILATRLPGDWLATTAAEGKFELLDFTSSPVTNQYAFITAVVGGAVFAMASHGADQLMVQRLLACRDLRDSQKALIASGFVVMLQFALFLFIGSMLWSFFRGADPQQLGLSSDDELFPYFIVNELPTGLSGLLIAGILAAAMSTLSSSLNSLSTSTVSDLYQRLRRTPGSDSQVLSLAKVWTLVWAVVFVGFASMFTSTDNPVVEVGLSIASYTYGALLGAFLLGLLVRRARQSDAVVAFLVTLGGVLYLALGITFPDGEGGQAALAFPWYTPVGVLITLVVGGLLSLRRPKEGLGEATEPAKAATE
ncbi:sodium:solute symporter [Saccharopolyspora rectivirgula]|uniref:Sodium:solute symporter n=1 Tax=Saccharopolyspora rectivirgula TaxID=28042 RepID=A0A073AT38_9PSEU|nr:sodium:solute symporter [Saccharopolyspora rectivirgula]KEI42988.1 sodium:solute symporter [Saccharopolyspora rectivirgula]